MPDKPQQRHRTNRVFKSLHKPLTSIPGVDYESLDRSEQEYAVKRLETALKAFGPGFHVYQYLFKSNRPDIPFAKYDDPIVEAAIDQRRKFFEAKRDHLYGVEIFYCILLEGVRSKTGVGTALARLLRDPEGAIAELKSQFTNDSMKQLLRTHIERGQTTTRSTTWFATHVGAKPSESEQRPMQRSSRSTQFQTSSR